MSQSTRIHPLEATRAMRALTANPDDTAQAFRVIAALSGRSGHRIYRRFRKSETGARILAEHRQLYDILSDLDRLQRMPEGSLGREIANFFTVEQISAQGLAAASESGFAGRSREAETEDERLLLTRLRDLHDVFHVLTGYGRDLRGEAAVLAFTVPQTRNPGVAYIVLRVLLRAGWRSEMGILIRQAFRRGLRSRWLIDRDWEALLEQPLVDVREELRVGPPPVYEPVRSSGAPNLS